MSERNIAGSATAAVMTQLVSFYTSLAPFMILAVVLIIVDCRFGVRAARRRKELIRVSRMWRRSFNKLIDYFSWITVAGVFGSVFGEFLGLPVLSFGILLVVYGIELSSIFSNYFASRGINKKINVFKLLGKSKLADIIEDTKENNK